MCLTPHNNNKSFCEVTAASLPPSSYTYTYTTPSAAQIWFDAALAPWALLVPSLLTTRIRASIALTAVWALFLETLPRQQQPPQAPPPREGHDYNYYYYYARCCLSAVLALLLLGTVVMSCLTATVVRRHSQPASPAAREVVDRGLRTGRIVPRDGYHVYLPPPQQTSQSSSYAAAGIIMIPGALVQHEAYAAVCSQLSEQGIVAVVIHLDPLRMPLPFYPAATPAGMAAIMTQLQQTHGVTVGTWALAGHSAGGSAVADMVRQRRLAGVDRVVLWGVNTTQDLERTPHVQALCITASKDGFKGNSMGRGLPSFDSWAGVDRLQHVEIQGGNHGGFGDYPPQTFPRKDGIREIPLAEQHKQIVQATAKFLLSKEE